MHSLACGDNVVVASYSAAQAHENRGERREAPVSGTRRPLDPTNTSRETTLRVCGAVRRNIAGLENPFLVYWSMCDGIGSSNEADTNSVGSPSHEIIAHPHDIHALPPTIAVPKHSWSPLRQLGGCVAWIVAPQSPTLHYSSL